MSPSRSLLVAESVRASGRADKMRKVLQCGGMSTFVWDVLARSLTTNSVTPGLAPAIHAFLHFMAMAKTWMTGTSPAMTNIGSSA
ncbi:hypothetical protein CIW50_10705 [Tardiphaga sp. P9-11]|nr:hypothetical protein CIW50_10705 [Tardiphaga sp. P9-11]